MARPRVELSGPQPPPPAAMDEDGDTAMSLIEALEGYDGPTTELSLLDTGCRTLRLRVGLRGGALAVGTATIEESAGGDDGER